MDSLDIRRGEQVALVGDNASGKSRLASVFAGRNAAKYITFRDSYGSYGDTRPRARTRKLRSGGCRS